MNSYSLLTINDTTDHQVPFRQQFFVELKLNAVLYYEGAIFNFSKLYDQILIIQNLFYTLSPMQSILSLYLSLLLLL